MCVIHTDASIFANQTDECKNIGCVQAACLPYDKLPVGKACWVAGWGKARAIRSDKGRDHLFEGGVNIFSNEYCKQRSLHLAYKKIQPDEFCAGTPGLG